MFEMLRAIAGLIVAFAASQGLANWMGWSRTGLGLAATTMAFVVLGLFSLFLTSGRPIQAALRAQRRAMYEQQEVLRSSAARYQFAADMQNALDMAETEEEAFGVAGRAIAAAHRGRGQLLLADSSRAHLRVGMTTDEDWSGCSVPTPWSCPAVRRGHTLEFASNTSLSACPRLAERSGDRAALCVPVTILGMPMGVVHAASDDEGPIDPAVRTNLETAAMQVGARVGVLRAMASSQRAASVDPLTGLMNRRTMEDRLRDLHKEGVSYAVTFADLDHFKDLNDTYGHAAGDRALSHFAKVVASVVRDQDLVCRYGGEEFVFVFPRCDVGGAMPVISRIQEALIRSFATSAVPEMTASYGLADSTYAEAPAEVIALADNALMAAKRRGRNRSVVAPRPLDPPPRPAPRLEPEPDPEIIVAWEDPQST